MTDLLGATVSLYAGTEHALTGRVRAVLPDRLLIEVTAQGISPAKVGDLVPWLAEFDAEARVSLGPCEATP